jgi:hypothetical protein
MAIKKSDLYSSLWASCDELRGGMDASQYKDYVLFMLFIKYVSDKYTDSNDFAPPVVIPKGASFKDMSALKGKPDIGDKINTQVIQPLIDANQRLARSDFPDFNDPAKLGDGKEMVERLSNLWSSQDSVDRGFSISTRGGRYPCPRSRAPGEFVRRMSSSRPIETSTPWSRCVASSASRRAATTSGSSSRCRIARRKTPASFA